MERRVEVLANKQALRERALKLVVAKITEAIAARGQCSMVLSGGSTPKPLYEAIAEQDLPWDKIQVFWGDERYVSADRADSNQRMARQAWLNRVQIPDSNIHPMPTQAGDPAIDAQQYEKKLLKLWQISAGEFPVFDLVLLGMGDDGHTASLFPHTDALTVGDRLVTVGNKDGQPRLTLTVPTINHARCVIFLVAGENKRPALRQVFAPSGDEMTYPSRLIQPQGELWWLLDRAAGAEIEVQ